MRNTFSETTAWKNAIIKTYSLKYVQQNSINFFSYNGKEYSSSPYATDSGIIKEENFNFDTNKKFLIKSRNKLNIDNKFNLNCSYYTFLLPLTNEEDVWQNYVKSKTRNQTRKGLKNDLVIKFGRKELLADFYHIISTAWRDLGTPTHSKKFYNNILDEFDENAELIVIYLNNEPTSAALLLYHKDVIAHPYAATLRKYNRFSINNALYWNIIKRGIENNCKYFDMGRSHKEQGTFKFKKSWGAEPVQLYYYYINYSSIPNYDSKLINYLTSIWGKLPQRLTTFLGPYFIKRVL